MINHRFSTEAANADVLGEDPPLEGQSGGWAGGDSTRDGERPAPGRGQAAGRGSVKPGKDINAPGFLKDRDESKPS